MTFEEFKSLATDLKSEPISCTCQVLISNNPPKFCDNPTTKAYPAMGGGWMALCARHSLKHKEAFMVDELIKSGESFE